MRDNDGRKLDRRALEVLRLRAVEQMLAGVRPDEVATALGFSRAAVYGWLASYRAGGRQALAARPARGRPPRISAEQSAGLWPLLIGTDPRQLHFGLALWTRGLVRELIHREFGIGLSLVTVRRLMAKMGLAPDQRRGPPTENWWAEEYPAIRARAIADDAVIYFISEQRVPEAQRFYQARQRAPAESGRPEPQVTMMFALSTKAELRFALYNDPPTAATFTSFCERLLHDIVGAVYLIVDGRLIYPARGGIPLAARYSGRVKVFYRVEHVREYGEPGKHARVRRRPLLGGVGRSGSHLDPSDGTAGAMGGGRGGGNAG